MIAPIGQIGDWALLEVLEIGPTNKSILYSGKKGMAPGQPEVSIKVFLKTQMTSYEEQKWTDYGDILAI